MTIQASQKWNTVKLGEIAQVIDCPHSTPKWEDTGIFAIRNFNLSNGRIVRHKESFVSEEEFVTRTKRAIPSKGDLVLSREAPIGTVGYISTDEKMCLGQRVVLIRTEKVDSEFLLYQFLSPLVQHQFNQSNGTGTTVSNLRIPIIKDTQILLPDLPTQKQIADVLSAYDGLIENNNRRIKILEETAQKIYKEWFVNFRFPEYKKVKMVESGTEFGMIPEGWELRTLDDCVFVHRGKSYTSEELVDEGGLPFVNLKCVNRYGGFRKDGIKGFSGKYKDTQKVEKGDIVMAVTDMTQERMIVARCARVPSLENGFGIISMDLVKIEPKDNCEKNFLYSFFRWSAFADEVKNHANGANVLHLNPERVSSYRFVYPPQPLQKLFSDNVECVFDEIDSIQLMNENLKKTRDLLIPQLVGGKLELK